MHPGSKYIVRLLDEFLLEGPNGCHQCLVFDLLGPTVNTMVDDAHHFGERLETDIIIRVSIQILKAVAFMHKAGYAHGGTVAFARVFPCISRHFTSLGLTFVDINLKNLAFHNGRLSRLSEEKLFEALGSPNPEVLTRSDGEPLGRGIPTQLVESAQWTGWPLDDDEDDENIRIIDLGEAFNQNAVPKHLAQPGGLQAPETIFTGKFDYRHDLWRVGLLVRTPLLVF